MEDQPANVNVYIAADSLHELFYESKRNGHKTGYQASSLLWNSLRSLDGGWSQTREMLQDYVKAGRLPTPEESTEFGPKGPKAFMTLLAFLFKLMENNPNIFTEARTRMDDVPPGTIFVLGHSTEDWNRALTVWQQYQSMRIKPKNKYSFGIVKPKSHKPHEFTVDLLEHKLAYSRRMSREKHQDEDNELYRLIVRSQTAPGVDGDKLMHQRTYDAFRAWQHMRKVNSRQQSRLPAGFNVTPANYLFILAMERTLCALHPATTSATYPSNPRPDVDVSQHSRIVEGLSRNSVVDNIQGAGSGRLSGYCPFLNMGLPPVQDKHGNAQSVFLITHICRFPDELAGRYKELLGLFGQDMYVDPVGPGKFTSDSHYDPTSRAGTIARLLDAAAVDMNVVRLLTATPSNAGLIHIADGFHASFETATPLGQASDCGASFIYMTTRRDERLETPTDRAALSGFLLKESPILSIIVGEIFKMVLGEKSELPHDGFIIVVCCDILNQM